MARFSWEPEYTAEDAADAFIDQVAHFVQQAHAMVMQAEALMQLVDPTSDEREISKVEAERRGILEQLERKYRLAQQLRQAVSDIKTAGQGSRPELGVKA